MNSVTLERPALHESDRQIMETLAHRLQQLVATPSGPPGKRLFERLSGRTHTVLISQPQHLTPEGPLPVVGFFGQKNPWVSPEDHRALWEIDEQLLDEVSRFPGILSVSCWELDDGNYANLVVLGNREAAEHWRTSPTHQRAVRDIAPKNYLSIRIHQGQLAHGQVTLLATKNFTF